ncbi:MAG: hypothetical protein ACRD0O_06190 [Acidimicrobiia bacterium]
MSSRLLVTLTVVEILALVGVLAFFLMVLTTLLSRVADNLHMVAAGVSSIEGHLTILAAVPMVNRTLDDIVGALPVIAQTANAKVRGRG